VTEDPNDYFVSYTAADQEWAEWIAWELELAGFTVRIQAWDIRPGNNFVVQMNLATKLSSHTLLVLSEAALKSDFVQSEWAAAFADDPSGSKRKVIPVRVDNCKAHGLLGPVVYIDLVDTTRDQARARLLSGVASGRNKPTTAPAFPSSRPSPGQTTPRESDPLDWQLLPEAGIWPPGSTRDKPSGQTTTALTVWEIAAVVEEVGQSRKFMSAPRRMAALLGSAGTIEPFSPITDSLNFLSRSDPPIARIGWRCGLSVTNSSGGTLEQGWTVVFDVFELDTARSVVARVRARGMRREAQKFVDMVFKIVSLP
jgi:hypothetical protein